EGLLVAAEMEQSEVLAARQQVQESIEGLHLLGWRVRPERVHTLYVAINDENTEQVDETAVLVTFGVKEDLHGRARQVGRAVDVDLLLADGEGLQRGMADVALPFDALAPLSRAERAGQLRQGEDPFAVVPLQLLLSYAPQQADVVCLFCLCAAPLS